MHADLDALQLEVRGALHRQRPEHGAFGVDAGTVASVVATDDLGDEGAIGSEVVEVTGAAQQQGLFDGPLEVAVGAFDAAVLMGLAAYRLPRPAALSDLIVDDATYPRTARVGIPDTSTVRSATDTS